MAVRSDLKPFSIEEPTVARYMLVTQMRFKLELTKVTSLNHSQIKDPRVVSLKMSSKLLMAVVSFLLLGSSLGLGAAFKLQVEAVNYEFVDIRNSTKDVSQVINSYLKMYYC